MSQSRQLFFSFLNFKSNVPTSIGSRAVNQVGRKGVGHLVITINVLFTSPILGSGTSVCDQVDRMCSSVTFSAGGTDFVFAKLFRFRNITSSKLFGLYVVSTWKWSNSWLYQDSWGSAKLPQKLDLRETWCIYHISRISCSKHHASNYQSTCVLSWLCLGSFQIYSHSTYYGNLWYQT